jgi:hypothetical protein
MLLGALTWLYVDYMLLGADMNTLDTDIFNWKL